LLVYKIQHCGLNIARCGVTVYRGRDQATFGITDDGERSLSGMWTLCYWVTDMSSDLSYDMS